MSKKTPYYLLILIATTFGCGHQLKTGYVSLNSIYEKFPMTKEMQTKMEGVENLRKSIVDSMAWNLNQISSKMGKNASVEQIRTLELQKESAEDKKQFFDRDNANAAREMNAEVWKQINQYVKDYGAENEYDYILGADGTGAIMYGSHTNDITGEVSDYVNKKYQGGTKK